MKSFLSVLLVLALAVVCGCYSSSEAAGEKPKHPYILWSAKEASAIRQRLENDPEAKKQYEWMVQQTGIDKHGHTVMMNLFNYAVLGDEKAGEREKGALLKFAGSVPEPLTKAFQEQAKNAKWVRGNASFSDRHMRDEQTLNVLRYDVLYDQLTAEERKRVEDSFRAYIKFHLDGHRPWHPDFRYGRMTWLPNMHWPRTIGTHLMAVALGDEELIKAMFNSEGGWKYYFDDYVGDGRFYMEEFGKYYSNIGTMLMYCEGLEHLGLGKYGYGYTGKGGANMERFLQMYFDLGFSRTEIPGGMASYPIVEMGDTPTRGLFGISGTGNADAIVTGYLPDGKTGGDRWFNQSRMNGPLPKLMEPLWWEMGHVRFPDAGFDYFLAQMRKPDEAKYYPSLFFGLKPIDPAQVKAPKVKSFVANERGFAFLKMEETSDYWESEKPAVALQFGMYYVHYAHDCFSLLGYQAFNRPIYTHGWGGDGGVTNESIQNHPRGYIGKHPWHDTVRGHAGGVVVDNLKAMPITSGENGLDHHRIRQNLTGPVKFVAGRVKPTEVTDTFWKLNEETGEMEVIEQKQTRGIYPGVDLERALILTDEYLFDAFWLKSDQPRQYDWHVTGAGSLIESPDHSWQASNDLYGSKLYRDINDPAMKEEISQPDGNDLTEVRKLVPGKSAWQATILQDGPHHENAQLPQAWYDAKIGVQVHMLPGEATTVYAGRPPFGGRKKKGKPYPEVGGQTIIARRHTASTIFAAVHEPFKGGPDNSRIAEVKMLAESESMVAARIVGHEKKGAAINDRVMIAFGDSVDQLQTVKDGDDVIQFKGYGWVRIGNERVDAVGNFQQIQLSVKGNPKLYINGELAN